MSANESWADPKTLIAVASLCVGVFGSLFGVLSFFWNRRESRLDALSKVLEPMVRAAQSLLRANTCRRTREQLKRSFPSASPNSEVAIRLDALMADYSNWISASEDSFRETEAEFAARSFRFPDRVCKLVAKAQASLAELGRLVNAGLFDKADLQLAKFRDDFKQISKIGRGWRLADPLEGIIRLLPKRRKQETPDQEFELSPDEMNKVMELLHKRATTQSQNGFAVHPPKILVEQPELANSEQVVDKLKDSVFVVTFQDGESRMLSLPELMAFVYNLIALQFQHQEMMKMLENMPAGTGEAEFKVSYQFSMRDIMRPEMVKTLLSKVDLHPAPSDE